MALRDARHFLPVGHFEPPLMNMLLRRMLRALGTVQSFGEKIRKNRDRPLLRW